MEEAPPILLTVNNNKTMTATATPPTAPIGTVRQQVHTENISPRQRFQQSGVRLSNHREMIASEAFKAAIDIGLLQYQTELAAKCTDANAAMRVGLCILGAQEFVTVLRQLGDTINFTRIPANDNLKGS